VDPNIIPTPHPDTWVNLLHGYVTDAVSALAAHRVHIHRSWLDPSSPRDATILCSSQDPASATLYALVWDEETGWRRGHFVSGRQGHRTALSEVAYLGGGILPEPDELVHRVTSRAATAARRYRSYGDLRDGLDDALRARSAPLAAMR
jgi:hypothetical protein